jgi:hypothetical protein
MREVVTGAAKLAQPPAGVLQVGRSCLGAQAQFMSIERRIPHFFDMRRLMNPCNPPTPKETNDSSWGSEDN